MSFLDAIQLPTLPPLPLNLPIPSEIPNLTTLAGGVIDTATGGLSAKLTDLTQPFTGVIGNLTGAVNGALGGAISSITGAIDNLTGGLAGEVSALFFRGQVVAIDDLAPDCTLTEDMTDTVTVTDHPVEIGAAITDHAFVNPSEVTMRLGWTESKGFASSFIGASAPSPTEAYERLRDLQLARDPIAVLTTKRAYSDMLIVGMAVRTDDKSANILDITVRMRQVILVSTSSTELKQEAQAEPDQTLSVQNVGTKLVNQVKQSALSQLGGLFGP